jgi:hypothetical protein
MILIEKKRVSDSVIIAKARLLQLTNNVSNLVSLLGVSTIMLPINANLKSLCYAFIMFCLIYSTLNGNDTAKKIIEERKSKGDLFTMKDAILNNNPSVLAKMTHEELATVRKVIEVK